MCGAGYVIDYCVARLLEERKEEAFRNYVCDAIQIISENTANFNGGKVMSMRFADLMKPPETRTAQQIIDEVVKKAGLKAVNK